MLDREDIQGLPSPDGAFHTWAHEVYEYARGLFLKHGSCRPFYLIIDGNGGGNMVDLTQMFETADGKEAAGMLGRAMVRRFKAKAIAFVSEIWNREKKDGPLMGESLMVNVEKSDGQKIVYFGVISRDKGRVAVIDSDPLVNQTATGHFANFFQDVG